MSGGRGWSIPRHCLELWQDFVLQDMGEVDFHFFENIGNSLHHQIPPNCASGLQIGPRFFLEARAPKKDN